LPKTADSPPVWDFTEMATDRNDLLELDFSAELAVSIVREQDAVLPFLQPTTKDVDCL